MIYFENYHYGTCGLNNHVIPYTLCLSMANFLGREFYFDFEVPPSTPPEYAVSGPLKEKFAILLESPRSTVSQLVRTPGKRVDEVDRNAPRKYRIEDPMMVCLSDEATMSRFGNTFIRNYFTLGREVLTREFLQEFDLIEVGESNLVNASYFYFLAKKDKDALLRSVRIEYAAELESLSSQIIGELGAYDAVHLRMGDFAVAYREDGFIPDAEKFREYCTATLGDSGRPVVVATDEMDKKEFFDSLLAGREYRFIDEFIFENFGAAFRETGLTDHGALSVIDQLVCAGSNIFVGTCRSTFTSVIHRLRQERYGNNEFNFFPDRRVAKLLDEDLKIKPDLSGFFDWNRYSVFCEDYRYPAWMREWDFSLTSLA